MPAATGVAIEVPLNCAVAMAPQSVSLSERSLAPNAPIAVTSVPDTFRGVGPRLENAVTSPPMIWASVMSGKKAPVVSLRSAAPTPMPVAGLAGSSVPYPGPPLPFANNDVVLGPRATWITSISRLRPSTPSLSMFENAHELLTIWMSSPVPGAPSYPRLAKMNGSSMNGEM